MTPRIRDLVEIPEVQTVIRLEDAERDSTGLARSFVFTHEVANHFTVLCESLQRANGRGYFLQGDFGSGKSHFLAALGTWLSARPGAETLSTNHPGLRQLKEQGKRFLPASVSLVDFRGSTSLEQILIQAVEHAFMARNIHVNLSPLARFLGYLREILTEAKLAEAFAEQEALGVSELNDWFAADPRAAYSAGIKFITAHGLEAPETLVEDRHETFARALQAAKDNDFDGIVFIIDELSEFFRSKSDPAKLNEDARTLQFLGELSNTEPVWTLAAVQESIERTGDIAQATFRKIKDRFPIKLQLSTLHIRDLISRRLIRKKENASEPIQAVFRKFRDHFPNFSCSYQEFFSIYPVHPVTLSLLEGLGDLFSEHRGIVDFIYTQVAGDATRQVAGILDRSADELLAPDSIYEHFAQRLAEFSAFHVFPRHITPHLDEVIESELEDADDRALARRLVRILILYTIHPTAETPNLGTLAELGGCMLTSQDPELNVQFVGEAVLDPVVLKSRFLVKQAHAEPQHSVYSVIAEEDQGKVMEARIARTAQDLSQLDSRLLGMPFAQLSESFSWPGRDFWIDALTRNVNWRQSARTAFIGFVHPGAEDVWTQRIRTALRERTADFALVFCFDTTAFACEHTAVWQVPLPSDEALVLLKEHLAIRLIAGELKPNSPADAPLIGMVNERLRRMSGSVEQAALQTIYRGKFTETTIRVEPAALQLRRFDRMLEAAAQSILEQRYPLFKEVCSKLVPPSPRLYQRLIEDLVEPGKLPLRDARSKGLADSVESLATPLGLIDLRKGSYMLAPDPARHNFLASVFNLIHPAGNTEIKELITQLAAGPYGMPEDMIRFLLTALAHSGLISLVSKGRRMPLEFLRLSSMDTVDAVAPGELIQDADIETLTRECPFLKSPQGWDPFGLRQQREAWQMTIRFKEQSSRLLDLLRQGTKLTAEYSALENLDITQLASHMDALARVIDVVKPSLETREGIERFLQAWRGSRLQSPDIEFLRKMQHFFTDRLEQFIAVHHYLTHTAVAAVAGDSPELADARADVLQWAQEPERVADDDGAEITAAFNRFRDLYTREYSKAHTAYYAAFDRKELNRHARRTVNLLRDLAAIEYLDRPEGLDQLLTELQRESPVCRRNLAEQLLRSPVCTCGFRVGSQPPPVAAVEPDQALQCALRQYCDILAAPPIQESIRARIYALQHLSPGAAERLTALGQLLENTAEAPLLLAEAVDPELLQEIRTALSGRTVLEERSLDELAGRLSGRRLSSVRIGRIVQDWIGDVPSDRILAISSTQTATPQRNGNELRWWAMTHPELFQSEPFSDRFSPSELRQIAAELETAYSAARIRASLERRGDTQLIQFIVSETCHTQAIQACWTLLAERVLGQALADCRIPEESAHADPDLATRIRQRLSTLEKLRTASTAAPPKRLTARLHLSALRHDPWSTAALQSLADKQIRALNEQTDDWFRVLPTTQPVNLEDAPVIILFDAVPADVWLHLNPLLESLLSGTRIEWSRLETAPSTLSGIAALFGLVPDHDPIEEFEKIEVDYHHLKGTEKGVITDLIPPPVAGRSFVLRLSAIDEAIHSEAANLGDVLALVQNIIERQLPLLRELCRRDKRRLILLNDHGLALEAGRLHHQGRSPFLQSMFRCEWKG